VLGMGDSTTMQLGGGTEVKGQSALHRVAKTGRLMFGIDKIGGKSLARGQMVEKTRRAGQISGELVPKSGRKIAATTEQFVLSRGILEGGVLFCEGKKPRSEVSVT